MTFPTSIVGLRQPIQDSSGVQAAESYTIALASSYQYQLGSAATPPFPAGWQVVPKGAFPLTAPAQMTTFATDTTAGGGLVAAQQYAWALSSVTNYGETPPGTISTAYTVGASGTGVLVTLPAVTVSTANPVIRRRLWRTKAGGSQLYYVADIPDLAVATYLDRAPDATLTLVNPTSNTSGLASPVSVTIASVGATEKAPGSTLVGGDFICDYTTGPGGGTVTFASADVGKLAVITYTASLDISAPFLGTLVTALQDMYNNGVLHGVSQKKAAYITNATYGPSAAAVDVAGSSQTLTTLGTTTVTMELKGSYTAITGAAIAQFQFIPNVDGTDQGGGVQYLSPNPAGGAMTLVGAGTMDAVWSGTVAAGTHTFKWRVLTGTTSSPTWGPAGGNAILSTVEAIGNP